MQNPVLFIERSAAGLPQRPARFWGLDASITLLLIVTSSKALVTSSDALVPSSY